MESSRLVGVTSWFQGKLVVVVLFQLIPDIYEILLPTDRWVLNLVALWACSSTPERRLRLRCTSLVRSRLCWWVASELLGMRVRLKTASYLRSQTYMAPWLSIFGDFTKDPEIMYNNFRVYGSCLLVFMGGCGDDDDDDDDTEFLMIIIFIKFHIHKKTCSFRCCCCFMYKISSLSLSLSRRSVSYSLTFTTKFPVANDGGLVNKWLHSVGCLKYFPSHSAELVKNECAMKNAQQNSRLQCVLDNLQAASYTLV
jgi:hypothetical protein